MLICCQLSFQDLREHFGVKVEAGAFLPAPLQPLAVPVWLQELLEDARLNPTVRKSGKAVSEAVIYPILAAVRRHYHCSIGLFSGEPLHGTDLAGICDFILSTDPALFEARSPIMVVVEAQQQGVPEMVPRCVGEMLAARQLHENAGVDLPAVYGCITTGNQWQFLQLSKQQVLIDLQTLYYPEPGKILAALSWIVTQFQ